MSGRGTYRWAVARHCREAKGGFWKPMAETAEEAGTSKARIAFAAKVLNQDPELLDAVIAGEASLNDAYFDVCARERAESRPTQIHDATSPSCRHRPPSPRR